MECCDREKIVIRSEKGNVSACMKAEKLPLANLVSSSRATVFLLRVWRLALSTRRFILCILPVSTFFPFSYVFCAKLPGSKFALPHLPKKNAST